MPSMLITAAAHDALLHGGMVQPRVRLVLERPAYGQMAQQLDGCVVMALPHSDCSDACYAPLSLECGL
jgi:hypothetical protein